MPTTTDRNIAIFFGLLIAAFVALAAFSTISPTPWSPVGEHREKVERAERPAPALGGSERAA